MRGRLDVREIEDIGDSALSYAEVKALASGDPRILEKARVDSETNRLERLHRAWSRNQRTLDATISSAEHRLPTLATDLARLEQALTQRTDTRGDAFAITIGSHRYDSRADAAIALRNTLATIDPLYRDVDARVIAHLGGFDVLAAGQRLLEPHLRVELAGVPRSGFTLGLDEIRPDRPLGIITKLENRVAAISQLRAEIEQEIHRSSTERDRAATELGQPFPHTAALATCRTRGTELAAELAEEATRHTRPAEAADPRPAADSSAPPHPLGNDAPDRADQPTRHGPTMVDPPDTRPATKIRTDAPSPEPRTAALDKPPPGGWSEADRVPATPPPAATSRWPSVQQHPLGTPLTVHAIAAGGPGRRLGHGTVTDHPGPEHVTVESPYGTSRTAHISHVAPYHSPARPAREEIPPPALTAPPDRWQQLARQLPDGHRLLDDPTWPLLATALEQAHAADYDLITHLPRLSAGEPLDERRPAADLLYRLANDCPAAQTPLPSQGYRTSDTPPRPPLQPPSASGITREPPRR